jgi:phosphonate dehydrogenase
MNRPKVVITHWVHDEVIQLLEQSCLVIANTSRDTLSREEVLRRTFDADALMAFMPDRIDENFLSKCPHLKVIAAALKGYDNFDIEACKKRGVLFTFVPSLLTESTAELAVGLLLGLSRNIAAGDRMVRSGQFKGWRPVLYGKGLSGSTVGIIGMGAVGQAISARLKPFGCHLVYSDPNGMNWEKEAEFGLVRQRLEILLGMSDFVVTAAPLLPETKHLINCETIQMFKPGAYLINVGRGSVVDETVVAGALLSCRIAGYAADVFEFEDWGRNDRPLVINPELLANSDKTLFTPHLGSAVDSVRREIALEAAQAILSVI